MGKVGPLRAWGMGLGLGFYPVQLELEEYVELKGVHRTWLGGIVNREQSNTVDIGFVKFFQVKGLGRV